MRMRLVAGARTVARRPCSRRAAAAAVGTVNLNWCVFNEPVGLVRRRRRSAARRSRNGRYKIVFNALPQRRRPAAPALVRRLAAKDSSIDIIGMDVIWTAEFAEAGWIKPWPGDARRPGRARARSPGPLATATYKGRLYAAPANSNTQLLWYRKDLVKTPPKTWDELIDQAVEDAAGRATSRSRARQYEGTTVWFNSLVAVGRAARSSTARQGRRSASRRVQGRATIMQQARDLPAADPSLVEPEGGPEPPRLRDRHRRLRGQLPVHLPERQGRRPEDLQATSPGRRTRRSTPGKPSEGADRRHQLGRRRLHQAPGRGLRGRGVPAQRGEPDASPRSRAACRRRSTASTTTRRS